jgi:hypothetical protein
MNCGCHGTVNAPNRVEFCPLHRAAEEMRALLEDRPYGRQGVYARKWDDKVSQLLTRMEP